VQNRKRLDLGELHVAAFIRSCAGERVSGDAVVIDHRNGKLFLSVIDGLGHGPEAHAVAVRAERFLENGWTVDPLDTLNRLHSELKGTIGAAAGACVLDLPGRIARYAGVGNTVFRTLGSRPARLLSVDGVVGGQMREPKVQTVELDPADVLLLYSDGVSDRFETKQYPQILCHNVSAIARQVVERFGKSHDDATCLAVKWGR
jgi:serine/threonine protein phosphatase PrpC